ncbi:MAG: hypothetical protein ACXWF8_17425 [Methylobacter sp.]
MKKILFLTILLSTAAAFADDAKNEWQNTTLSDATIKKIQDAQYQYKKCVAGEMQKSSYQDQESRRATEEIIKQCESVLSQIRDVYLAEKVPDVIADRHLKQLRIQTTRNVLQGMMFNEAARKAGQ